MGVDTYETHLEDLKWKIGFRPASAETWDFEWAKTGETARQRAIRILEQALADLKSEERLGASPLEATALEGERPSPPKKSARRDAKAAVKRPTKATAAPARASARAREAPKPDAARLRGRAATRRRPLRRPGRVGGTPHPRSPTE